MPPPRREATNEELYDNANIEILRHRLYHRPAKDYRMTYSVINNIKLK